MHVINLHIFSINEVYAVILTQSFLAGRQPAVVNFSAMGTASCSKTKNLTAFLTHNDCAVLP